MNHERPSVNILRSRDAVNKPTKEIQTSIDDLVGAAKKDAFQRIPNKTEVKARVENVIEGVFRSYLLESAVISSQLLTPEILTFSSETSKFLKAKIGIFVCSDGRIWVLQLADPKVAGFYHQPQGIPPTRESTRGNNEKMVLNDPYISAAIKTNLRQMRKAGLPLESVQFVGPHLDSMNPEDLSCGACTDDMRQQWRTVQLAMAYGGVKEYFTKVGGGIFAFDNSAGRNGGRGSTFDLTHDTYAQSFILGLRNAYDKFDYGKTLRKNLEELHKDNVILMTELLDTKFKDRIVEEAKKRGIDGPVDIYNYYNFGQNAILIGEIARKLTEEQGQNGFSFVPDPIKENKTENAIAVAAYHCIRNVVYRTVSGIKPGSHRLREHPEQFIRVGPIGAEFNVGTIPFIESTTPGPIQKSAVDAVSKLNALSYGTFKEQKIDVKNRARLILVTGSYDPKLYADEEIAEAQLDTAEDIVQNNAAEIRLKCTTAIKEGEVVVLGALHEPGTKKLTHIV